MKRCRPLTILVVLVALIAAACGGSSDDESAEEATTTIDAAAVDLAPDTIPDGESDADSASAPDDPDSGESGLTWTVTSADGVASEISDTSRIVSLNGDITEIIFELGLGDSVVGIDVTTTHPDAAAALPVVGFGQQLAAEPVLGFQPTLVIGDEQVAPPEAIQQLRDAGIPVVIIETQTDLDGVADKISDVAAVLNVNGDALAQQVQAEIDDARALASAAESSPDVAFVYARGPQTILLFGSGMPTQSMIEGAGAVDTGAGTGVFGAVPLTPEALVAAAPEVIVLPEAGLAALGGEEAFLGVPGVAETPAGESGSFLTYDEAYFFNLGPRTGQALREFVLDLHPELG